MTDAGPAARPGWPHWKTLLLVVSLAGNLLVAGLLVAGYFRAEHRDGGRMSGPSFTQILPRRFLHELDDARRKELFETLRADKDRFREDRRGLRDAALAVSEALAAEPYDAARTKAAIEAYGARSRVLVDLGIQAATGVVDKLNPDERKLLAERIKSRAERRGRKEQ